MRKTLMMAALLFALCRTSVAGEMPTPPAPTPQANATQEPTGGDMPNGIMQNGVMANGAADGLTRIALDLLAVLPSLP
jgi:hypothetical protein